MKKILFLYAFLIVCITLPGMATETIEYYVDGTLYDTKTCDVGDDIVLPTTAPTKTGYTFGGWDYRKFDMSTLDHTINGNTTGYAGYSRSWSTGFTAYGTVYGTAVCSGTPGSTVGETGDPELSDAGNNCWCRVTKFLRAADNLLYEPEVSVWAYVGGGSCNGNCGYSCAVNTKTNSSLRAALYGK